MRFRVLNINLDTATPIGKLMLTMLGAIVAFEREMMLERQAEGMARAKAEGGIKGRPATARSQAIKVVELAEKGLKRKEIAATCKISLASVYRILARMDELKEQIAHDLAANRPERTVEKLRQTS